MRHHLRQCYAASEIIEENLCGLDCKRETRSIGDGGWALLEVCVALGERG